MAEEKLNISWDDDFSDIDEDISEEDVKRAEAMGKVPIGKYLCECVDSQLQQYDGEYSCIEVNLRWKVLKVLELDGKTVEGDMGEVYENRTIFDTVKLFSPKEKENTGNRRILVATRIGLIVKGGKLPVKKWQEAVGKRAILTYIDSEWTPKGKTVPIKKRQVAFDGYESANGIEITDQTPDIDEI
jgi:hypothetical protein